jgi:hypothetical protein
MTLIIAQDTPVCTAPRDKHSSILSARQELHLSSTPLPLTWGVDTVYAFAIAIALPLYLPRSLSVKRHQIQM